MKKTELYFCVYNERETQMYGMFPEKESAMRWIKKIHSVIKEPLIVKESSFEMELPSGIDFSKETDGFTINERMSPMQNMAMFVQWSYSELKHNLNDSYEGIVALEIMNAIVRMSIVLKDAEEQSNKRSEEKLKESHKQFLEAGKIFGIEFMLNYTYDFWRNQDEKDALVIHYYDKMQKKK